MIPELVNEMQIPNDIESAVLDLKGLGGLITAAEWQRAALVFAFTYEGRPGGRSTGQESPVALSIDEFSKLGLAGLKSRNSVRKYRRAWALAIQDGFATYIMPGDLIALPEVEWDEYFNPPKAPQGPSEGSGDTEPKPKRETGSTGESEPDTGLPEDIDLDVTKPGAKRSRQGFQLLQGIEPARVPEKFRGGLERLKTGLTEMAEPGANYELVYLKMCQALGDLTAVLNTEN
ncbi:hypothetical protein ACFXG4_23560 [Nocardia sp. NPDC059246]|uniref:hypothetical protein n=1 Tax=unclassified Nocardia TaxID=2637762 RepID=UPI003675EA49